MKKNSHELLLHLLLYDPSSGVFFRRLTIPDGEPLYRKVGSLNKQGYTSVSVFGKKHVAHRLAWFYMKGVWPEYQVRHRNLIKTDNRWDNLYETSHLCVETIQANNTTGYPGVTRRGTRFQATIRVDKVKRHLGYFDDPEKAYDAYLTAKGERWVVSQSLDEFM